MLQRDDEEHKVPSDWQASFEQIVSAFLEDDFQLQDHPIKKVRSIDHSTAKSVADNIRAYGGSLVTLKNATWKRSVYRWMDSYWLFLVDLSTEDEEVSDLTLHARLNDAPGARLEVLSVHVP